MSPAAGIAHAVERIHRWPYARRRAVRPRNQGNVRQRIERELAVLAVALRELDRLPPPRPLALTPERRAAR